MGRPRKPRSELRSEVVNVRITPAEKKALERAAKKTGRTPSEVLMRPWRKGNGE